MAEVEQILLIIEECLVSHNLPKYNFHNVRSKRFERKSHLLWAAEELSEYVSERKDVPPEVAVYQFVKNLRMHIAECEKPSYPFIVAHELSSDVLDICRAAGWIN